MHHTGIAERMVLAHPASVESVAAPTFAVAVGEPVTAHLLDCGHDEVVVARPRGFGILRPTSLGALVSGNAAGVFVFRVPGFRHRWRVILRIRAGYRRTRVACRAPCLFLVGRPI